MAERSSEGPTASPSPGGGGSARGWAPAGADGSRVSGLVRVPGSKSIAQRVLLAGALAEGSVLLDGLPLGADVEHALGAVEALGGAADPSGAGSMRVARVAIDLPTEATVEVGESGTLARLATAVAALARPAGCVTYLVGSGTLARRRSPALFGALAAAGAGVRAWPGAGGAGLTESGSGWPVTVIAAAPPAVVQLRSPSSSQELSALLLALAAAPGERTVEVVGRVPSRPYVALTRQVLARFGAAVTRTEVDGGERFVVRGPLRSPPRYSIEADASSAAVALAAGCLSGGEVRVAGLGLGSIQGDRRIVEHLRSFGCEAQLERHETWARGAPTRGAELDLTGEPDLAPVLAVIAAAATRVGGPSLLSGLQTLRGKESDRLAGLAGMLGACGFGAEVGEDSLLVRAGPSPAAQRDGIRLDRLRLDPAGDHRMAFAIALLGLLRPAVVCVDPRACAKSWPSFWDDLAAAGARTLGDQEPRSATR